MSGVICQESCWDHILWRRVYVKQGSVLSPALFLLVMNPFLVRLQQSGLGLSINDFYTGGFLYADDIRTLASSSDSLKRQISIVEDFSKENLLRLNLQKCEIVNFSLASYFSQHHPVTISHIPETSAAKYLGYWWSRDLLATHSIEENIKKARGCFFHHGSLGSFHGDNNPLSTKSVIDACVMPVLHYGCENWILTERAIHQLESFFGWMIKKATKWPQHLSNTGALITLGVESVKSRILTQKLGFLL